jgi:F0F1-type ATP synthase assembly protein I
VFDLAARRQLNRGYSDGLSRALEIVVTPLLFGFLGRLVDNWLGTAPWFMIGLGAFAVTGMFVRFWLGYDREMQAHEANIPKAKLPEAAAPQQQVET